MSKPTPQQILDELKSVKTDAKRARSAVEQFEKTSKKKAGYIEALLNDSRKKVTEIVSELKDRLTKESTSFKSTAKDEASSVEVIRKEAKLKYNRFNQTYSASMNKRNGVEAKHQKVASLAEKVSYNANEVSKNLTKVTENTKRVSDLLTSSRNKDREIRSIYENAEKINKEIEDTYAITLDASMAGTFKERRDALEKRTRVWEWAYLSSVTLIVLAVILILVLNREASFIDIITERLVFVTPLLLISFVISRQFSHERKLFEEYAFKTAAAQSLRGYTILLNSEFHDVENARSQILKFTIAAMEQIYDRGAILQNPSTMHLAFGNNFAKFEAKIEDSVEKAVKKAIPNIEDMPTIKVDNTSISTTQP